MLIKGSIKSKLLFYINTIIFVMLALLGTFIGIRNHEYALKKAEQNTKLLAENRAQQTLRELDKCIALIEQGASVISLVNNTGKKVDYKLLKGTLLELLNKDEFIKNGWIVVSNKVLSDTSLLPVAWTLVTAESSNHKVSIEHNRLNVDDYLKKYGYLTSTKISEPYKNGKSYFVNISTPVFNNGGEKIGYLGFVFDLKCLNKIVKDKQHNQINTVSVLTDEAVFIAHPDNTSVGDKFSDDKPDENEKYSVEANILKGVEFDITYKNDKGLFYYYFKPFNITENQKWFIQIEVPMHVVLQDSKKGIAKSALIALIGFIIISILIYFISKSITVPINKVTTILDYLAKGNLNSIKDIEIDTGDELQKMGKSLNKVVSGLKKTEKFAIEIGKGKFDAEYTLLSDDDQLGKVLINMRDSLKRSADEEQKRKEEDAKETWTTRGITKFGEILRNNTNDLQSLGSGIVTNLIDYLKITQGALFVLQDEDTDNPYFKSVSAVAYDRNRKLDKEIHIGEGLVGKCAFEKKSIYLTEVPDDYINITSGLGDANPNCILIVPCILNDIVYAVIEIASFTPLKEHEIKFVERLSESIGSTISNVKINEKTSQLLKESQKTSEELSAQEEELRQNLEEMEATQEDLQRQMKENEIMKQRFVQQSALLDSLLNSLPDYIYFKDKNSKYLKISKSMLSLFGAKTVDEVTGKSDFDFYATDIAKKSYQEEQEIMNSLKGFTNKILREINSDGAVIWNSVTKLPLLTEEGDCIGTFGVSKDVTELKEMEIRTQIQKSELSSIIDAIKNSTYMAEYDADGKIIDINDALLKLLNLKKEKIIGKYHNENIDIKNIPEQDYNKFWKDILNGKIKHLQNKISINNKKIVLSETYSPIFDVNNKVVKVIKIAFDITKYVNK